MSKNKVIDTSELIPGPLRYRFLRSIARRAFDSGKILGQTIVELTKFYNEKCDKVPPILKEEIESIAKRVDTQR